MNTALFFLILFLFTAISWFCYKACQPKPDHPSYGEEHRPFVDKKGLHKYDTARFEPKTKLPSFPPKEYGLTKETKYQKQRSSWK